MPAGLTILSGEAGAGKTCLSVGVLRAIANRCPNLRVAGFKAVAVGVSDALSSHGDAQVDHLARAARSRISASVLNPIRVAQGLRSEGTMVLAGGRTGRVRCIGRDTVDFSSCSERVRGEAMREITVALTTLKRQADFIVVEGSGGVGTSEVDDLGNRFTARVASFPVVAVISGSEGGYRPSAYLDAWQSRIEGIRGYVLNRPTGPECWGEDPRVLGSLPEIAFADGKGRPLSLDEEYEAWARAVESGCPLLIQSILRTLGRS